MKYAFLFPGQGAQTPGMIKDVCDAFPVAKKTLSRISEIAEVDMEKLMWESDGATLSRSDNSQLSVMSASLVIAEVLKEKGIVPSAAMGFSLGEFPALCVSGVLDFETCVRVVKTRGKIMQEVCEAIANENAGAAPGMSAIVGLSQEKVIKICSQCKDVYAANLNSTKQTVISGTFAGLTQAESLAKEAGARRALRLAVAGPYHSPLMQRAADNFEKAIACVEFKDPKIALFSNVTGERVFSGSDAKNNAILHMTHPVQWTKEEAALASLFEKGEWRVLECGVGRVLTGLWKDTSANEKQPCTAVNSAEAIASL